MLSFYRRSDFCYRRQFTWQRTGESRSLIVPDCTPNGRSLFRWLHRFYFLDLTRKSPAFRNWSISEFRNQSNIRSSLACPACIHFTNGCSRSLICTEFVKITKQTLLRLRIFDAFSGQTFQWTEFNSVNTPKVQFRWCAPSASSRVPNWTSWEES